MFVNQFHVNNIKEQVTRKNKTFMIALLLAFANTTLAYDFSAVAPSGQTLYYKITSDTSVSISHPNNYSAPHWGTYEMPSGILTIPSIVEHNHRNYIVTSIEIHSFNNCSTLTSVSIPTSISSIGGSAFQNCKMLTSINIPNTIDSLNDEVFRNCTQLQSINIPNSITYIGISAFEKCTKLSNITIPSSIKEIMYNAFYDCIGLREIIFKSHTPPNIYHTSFFNVPPTVPVYIPCGTLTQYATLLPSMNNLIEKAHAISSLSADEQKGIVQVLITPTCAKPNAVLNAIPFEGYRFDHWSTGSSANPYRITVSTDTVITAYFTIKPDGIKESEADNIRIYVQNNRIIVEGAEGKTIRVFDTMGRLVGDQALPTGIYYVKIGNYATRKVAIFK